MSLFTIFATSKVAASALAAGTLAVGGTGAAAFAGALPADVQQSAHELLGAPAPRVGGVSETATSGATAEASATPSASVDADAAAAGSVEGDDASAEASAAAAVGPDATGPAAYGLCTAFTKGGLAASSTGFTSLAVAAEGEANIDSYCADVVAAGNAEANAAAKADGNKADVAGSGAAAVDVEAPEVPEAPELPTQAAVPAAPELPAEVPTELPELPTSAGRP
ncbi:protein tyrosine phosphatase [Arthrobacter oryzae]|uniref:protein tyrosine phosphatase n=1 Tax=Arthrobacter oryzae TaxID=409290 RepID=UPI0030C95C69